MRARDSKINRALEDLLLESKSGVRDLPRIGRIEMRHPEFARVLSPFRDTETTQRDAIRRDESAGTA
jgi:hypothetical protein